MGEQNDNILSLNRFIAELNKELPKIKLEINKIWGSHNTVTVAEGISRERIRKRVLEILNKYI